MNKRTLAIGSVMAGVTIALTAMAANVVVDIREPATNLDSRAENILLTYDAIATGSGDTVTSQYGTYATLIAHTPLPPGTHVVSRRLRNFALSGTFQKLELKAAATPLGPDGFRASWARVDPQVRVTKVNYWNAVSGSESAGFNQEDSLELSDRSAPASTVTMDDFPLNGCAGDNIWQFRGSFRGNIAATSEDGESCVNINGTTESCYAGENPSTSGGDFEYQEVFEAAMDAQPLAANALNVIFVESIARPAPTGAIGGTAGGLQTAGEWVIISRTGTSDQSRPMATVHEWGHFTIGPGHTAPATCAAAPAGQENLMCSLGGSTFTSTQCATMYANTTFEDLN